MTTKSVKKLRPTTVRVGPNTEWADAPGLQELFNIRRSLAYHLLNSGLIESVSLKDPGQTRGKRLFRVASVRAYLNSKLQGAEPQ